MNIVKPVTLSQAVTAAMHALRDTLVSPENLGGPARAYYDARMERKSHAQAAEDAIAAGATDDRTKEQKDVDKASI